MSSNELLEWPPEREARATRGVRFVPRVLKCYNKWEPRAFHLRVRRLRSVREHYCCRQVVQSFRLRVHPRPLQGAFVDATHTCRDRPQNDETFMPSAAVLYASTLLTRTIVLTGLILMKSSSRLLFIAHTISPTHVFFALERRLGP